jgi:lipoprotein-anchoring transpeptidase ErfK/SrfK
LLAGLTLAILTPTCAVAAPASASVVATAIGKVVTVYRAPRAGRVLLRLPNTTTGGGPAVFLVKSRRPGWEQIYLPLRPNGRTGWVRDSEVGLTRDGYRVAVSLSAHKLTVTRNGVVVDREPVGVGTTATPTPTGHFYLVELLTQTDPNGLYGPYAFGLSAYSDVLSSFGGGPGQIGLHGTDDPSGLGTSVSHGCVRISNAAIARLARLLPLGTPVVITN